MVILGDMYLGICVQVAGIYIR